MNYVKARLILEEKKALLSDSKLRAAWQKVRSHSHRYETFEHFVAKACLLKLIIKKDRPGKRTGAVSEYEFPDGRRVDILQIIDKDKQLVGYEVESSSDNKKKSPRDIDIITVDLRKMPNDVVQAFKTLKKYFDQYVVEVD